MLSTYGAQLPRRHGRLESAYPVTRVEAVQQSLNHLVDGEDLDGQFRAKSFL